MMGQVIPVITQKGVTVELDRTVYIEYKNLFHSIRLYLPGTACSDLTKFYRVYLTQRVSDIVSFYRVKE